MSCLSVQVVISSRKAPYGGTIVTSREADGQISTRIQYTSDEVSILLCFLRSWIRHPATPRAVIGWDREVINNRRLCRWMVVGHRQFWWFRAEIDMDMTARTVPNSKAAVRGPPSFLSTYMFSNSWWIHDYRYHPVQQYDGNRGLNAPTRKSDRHFFMPARAKACCPHIFLPHFFQQFAIGQTAKRAWRILEYFGFSRILGYLMTLSEAPRAGVWRE